MNVPVESYGSALGSQEQKGRFDPPLNEDEQRKRDAERERLWDSIVAAAQS